MTTTIRHEIPSANVDSWTAAEGRIDGRPSLLRFRPGLAHYLGDARFTRRLHVTWTYEDDGSSGMPSDRNSADMKVLEDRLVSALEAAHAGVLAFVFTYGGNREWHIYVNDSVELGEVINEALADLPRLPIEMAIEDDPEWTELANVIQSARE